MKLPVIQTLRRQPGKIASHWMILVGLVLGSYSLVQGIADVRRFNSPFDQVGQAGEDDQGFLPIVSGVGASNEAEVAPAIEGYTVERAFSNQDREALGEEPRTAAGPVGNSSDQRERAEADLSHAATGPATSDRLATSDKQADSAEPPVPVYQPDRISIPAIQVDAPIQPVALQEIEHEGTTYRQWTAPNSYTVGWHPDSASLGRPGNTVLNGHHNVYGEVFRDLDQLEAGDKISIHSGDQVFVYQVGLKLILPERFKSLQVRLDNAKWILPSADERITLVSCWPYESNNYRIVIVAMPLTSERGDAMR